MTVVVNVREYEPGIYSAEVDGQLWSGIKLDGDPATDNEISGRVRAFLSGGGPHEPYHPVLARLTHEEFVVARSKAGGKHVDAVRGAVRATDKPAQDAKAALVSAGVLSSERAADVFKEPGERPQAGKSQLLAK